MPMQITVWNYVYGLRKTTDGKYYIVRSFSKKGYEKWKKGLLENKSGIINI